MSDTKEEVLNENFALRLEMFRKEHVDKNQNRAAKKLGVAQSHLSYMERGLRPIRYEFISKLVKEYNLNQEWFSTGAGDLTTDNSTKSGPAKKLGSLNEDLELLKKQIRFMEANHNYMLKLIEKQNAKIEELEKKLGRK